MVWLGEEWNNPSRSDVYAMQVAHEARHAFAKTRPAFRQQNWQLPFKTVKGEPLSDEKRAELAVQRSKRNVFLAFGRNEDGSEGNGDQR